MKVVVIEDEKLSADHLTTLLKKIDESIEVVGLFESVKESVAGLSQDLQFSLMFVDIHLADGLSFEIFKALDIDIPIIFTTAYDEYAIKAFKLNSIDYLLKPVSLEDLKGAIDKYKKVHVNEHQREDILEIIKNVKKVYKIRFMAKMGSSLVSVKAVEIQSIVAEDGVVLLLTKNNKKYISEYPLDQLEKMLDPELFFRINRKTIVNIESIEKVETYFNSRLKILVNGLEGEQEIVSRERVKDFKAWLGK